MTEKPIHTTFTSTEQGVSGPVISIFEGSTGALAS